MATIEEWRPVPGWLDYEVSSYGELRRSKTAERMPGHVFRQKVRYDGYSYIAFQRLVHRIVAEAFLGPRPPEHVVNHKNGNKADNRVDNLEWVTRTENVQHAYRHGLQARGEGAGRAKLKDAQIAEIRARYHGKWGSQTRLAEEYGVSQALISQIVRGDVWTHVAMEHVHQPVSHNGPHNNGTKLNERFVREIRDRFAAGNVSQRQLAQGYGVTPAVITGIIRGKTWKHVDGPIQRRSGGRGVRADSQDVRIRHGEDHPFAKITGAIVREIREKYAAGSKQAALAAEYSISQSSVSKIVLRKDWKHIE